MTTYAPFPLIDLSGSPRERGRTHGKAAGDRLRRGIRMYSESLLKSGVDWPELARRAEAMVPAIEKFDPTYVEEMRGIAEGSGEPFAGVRERRYHLPAGLEPVQRPPAQHREVDPIEWRRRRCRTRGGASPWFQARLPQGGRSRQAQQTRQVSQRPAHPPGLFGRQSPSFRPTFVGSTHGRNHG